MIDHQYEKDRRDVVIDAIKDDIRADLENIIDSVFRHWSTRIDLYSIPRDTIVEMLRSVAKELK